MLKDAPILMLDEPTASLDAETELRVLAESGRVGRGRAIFLVTHRLSTMRHADQIVVPRGRPRRRESGTHEELMARAGGAYRALVERETRRAGTRGRAAHERATSRADGSGRETLRSSRARCATSAPFRWRFAVQARL